MRPVAFAALLGLAACSENVRFVPVSVQWMDWPAVVSAGDPFRTRLVVYQPCALIRGFEPAPSADASAVTFAPYFVADKEPIGCYTTMSVASEMLVTWAIDTAGTAPGLYAYGDDVARTYEMRALAPACPGCALLNSAPILIFGQVTASPALRRPAHRAMPPVSCSRSGIPRGVCASARPGCRTRLPRSSWRTHPIRRPTGVASCEATSTSRPPRCAGNPKSSTC